MSTLADIGTLLVRARRAAGVTQAELGLRVGVAQPQVARWEASAYANVALERVSEVARALGITSAEWDLPLVAEPVTEYAATLVGAEPEALRALSRSRASTSAIAAFARSHGVSKLWLFGSVLRPDFGPASDIDVLVEYEPERTPSLLGLADHEIELAAILGRPVDLVPRRGIERSENTIRRERILGEARQLYARP